ncbi:MAG: RNA polymerase sigma factor [Bdellovibrionia bacterium]
MKPINYANLPDKDLLITLSKGDKEALSPLYERHSGRVLQLALRSGLPKERAEDVVQIVFMQLWRKKDLYSPQHEALAWIYVITKSEIRDYCLREKRPLKSWDFTYDMSQIPTESPIKDESYSESIKVDLQALDPIAQKAVELRYLEEKEFREIAQVLGKSEVNVRKIISRSLALLRKIKSDSV